MVSPGYHPALMDTLFGSVWLLTAGRSDLARFPRLGKEPTKVLNFHRGL